LPQGWPLAVCLGPASGHWMGCGEAAVHGACFTYPCSCEQFCGGRNLSQRPTLIPRRHHRGVACTFRGCLASLDLAGGAKRSRGMGPLPTAAAKPGPVARVALLGGPRRARAHVESPCARVSRTRKQLQEQQHGATFSRALAPRPGLAPLRGVPWRGQSPQPVWC